MEVNIDWLSSNPFCKVAMYFSDMQLSCFQILMSASITSANVIKCVITLLEAIPVPAILVIILIVETEYALVKMENVSFYMCHFIS